MKVGDVLKHPDHKNPVKITEIDGDMVAFTVWAPLGGSHRAWATRASFTERPWMY